MKLLSELYADLSYGELSNTAVGLEGAGAIREQDRPKIVGYLNEALIRIHSRFLLRENEVLIKLYGHITNYHLLKKYAESQQEPEAEGFAYILDLLGEPFQEDVIKILGAKDSIGQEYVLNDPDDLNSLYTPQINVLQVPRPIPGVIISVLYQAKHPQMRLEDLNGEEGTNGIDIPDVLYGALKAYIAYKVFSHMNTQESTAKGQEHLTIYEAICTEAVDRDLIGITMSSSNNSFEKRGFV